MLQNLISLTVKGKAPWEWNVGNQVCPEDIAAVMKRDDEYQHMMFREWKLKTGRKNLSITNGGIYVLEPERVVET